MDLSKPPSKVPIIILQNNMNVSVAYQKIT